LILWPYPDFDVEGIHAYAKSKVWKWCILKLLVGSLEVPTSWTSVSGSQWQRTVAKSGYVGDIIERWKPLQPMVWITIINMHWKAADYKIMIRTWAVRPTGISEPTQT
jgi:hypothetical protein